MQRRERGPLLVVWERRDAFLGEDEPPIPFSWPWSTPQARAMDVFGDAVQTRVDNGHLHLSVSITPVFIEAQEDN